MSASRLNDDKIPSTRLSLVELEWTNDCDILDKHFEAVMCLQLRKVNAPHLEEWLKSPRASVSVINHSNDWAEGNHREGRSLGGGENEKRERASFGEREMEMQMEMKREREILSVKPRKSGFFGRLFGGGQRERQADSINFSCRSTPGIKLQTCRSSEGRMYQRAQRCNDLFVSNISSNSFASVSTKNEWRESGADTSMFSTQTYGMQSEAAGDAAGKPNDFGGRPKKTRGRVLDDDIKNNACATMKNNGGEAVHVRIMTGSVMLDGQHLPVMTLSRFLSVSRFSLSFPPPVSLCLCLWRCLSSHRSSIRKDLGLNFIVGFSLLVLLGILFLTKT